MPRKARVKSPESIYHIMNRSISEALLFRDEDDKNHFLGLLKRYTDRYNCSLYAYCIMDNHFHLHLDPRGYDISKFMQSLATAYVRHYNTKYNRVGNIFAERFESKILDTTEYNLTVSAYIHNNPHDIEGFCGKEEAYRYSSYGIYLGIAKDTHQLIDKSFMMSLFNISDEKIFSIRYLEFVSHQRDIGSLAGLKRIFERAVENDYISGRKVLLRELSPSKVISFISDKMTIMEKSSIAIKSKQKLVNFRAFTAYALRVLSGLGYKEICSNMFNITISGCSRLCSKGYELLSKDSVFPEIFDELVSYRCLS